MTEKDKLLASIDFLRRIGATQVQVRYSDDEKPDIWMIVAKFKKKNNVAANEFEIEASLDPTRAALRLCERLADGSVCSHCHKRVALEPDSLARMPFDQLLCWYQYDPEMKKFRRGCE